MRVIARSHAWGAVLVASALVLGGRTESSARQDRAECFAFARLDEVSPYLSSAEECAIAAAPASTFKLPHAVIALQADVVSPDVIWPWDGERRGNASWERDHTLATAIRWSVLPFFQRTARLLGANRMREGLASLGYSADGFDGDVATFWLNGDLVVTPLEQLSFLQRLFANRLPVLPAHLQTVRAAMEIPPGVVYNALGPQTFDTGWPAGTVVHAKTGHATVNGQDVNWLVGALVHGGGTHVFVARVRGVGVARTAAIDVAAAQLRSRVASPRPRQVAITIDDLPRGGDGGPTTLDDISAMTRELVQPFRDRSIPVTGFVNEGRHRLTTSGLRQVLDVWLDAGADLGNHAFSHPDLNNVPLAAYTADITKGEPITRAALAARGKRLEYFRHPYLHAGATDETRRGLEAFLHETGYLAAPVTLDVADYMFAALYTRPEFRERARAEYVPYFESVVAFFEQRALEVVGRAIPHVLLIHANALNAEVMPDLLAMFERRGYRVVALSEALSDPAYQLPDGYVGRGGFSWIHRWSRAKGMQNKVEPDPSEWVTKTYAGLARQWP